MEQIFRFNKGYLRKCNHELLTNRWHLHQSKTRIANNRRLPTETKILPCRARTSRGSGSPLEEGEVHEPHTNTWAIQPYLFAFVTFRKIVKYNHPHYSVVVLLMIMLQLVVTSPLSKEVPSAVIFPAVIKPGPVTSPVAALLLTASKLLLQIFPFTPAHWVEELLPIPTLSFKVAIRLRLLMGLLR